WAAEFERTCTRQHWLSTSLLESTLTSALTSGANLTLSPELILVGFDRMTPAQRDLLVTLESRGSAITEFRSEPAFAPGEAHRRWVIGDDQRDEIAACAAWARDLLLENPRARIGIVVPSTETARGEIDRAFRRVLLPASEDIRQASTPLPWEFSLGQPLAGVPAVRAALLFLRWIVQPLPEEQISWITLSGFVADAVTNHLALAAHDARQRRYGVLSPEESLAGFRESLRRAPALGSLQRQLYDLARSVESKQILSSSRLASAWTDLVPQLLDRVGWPGERTADSVQYQALQRWQRLLDDIALLDFDSSRLGWTEFIELLDLQAQQTIFAPESHDAPIQIMGPFESSGQKFDAIWFLGTDDTAWPQRGRLHPLLPASVQRQFAMPHATPDDDWNLGHIVTARLLASASRVIFSFAQRDKDAELRPSPLIASLFAADARPEAAADFRSATEPARVLSLDEITDDSGALAWPIEQNAGGADVLKRQAACPFQAFAAKRLRAEALDETEWGISPSAKGKLLHTVMQRLFSEDEPIPLRTRDDLVAVITTNQLEGVLDAHIDASIRTQFGAAPDPWQQACLAAEKRRLKTRITAWLELEAGRQPFTVEACERRLEDVRVGDLRLNLRADRIDRLADGSRLLLDYKTGLVSPSSWDGNRPEDPQLPLYAAYGNMENVSGIVFARIRAGKIDFEGRVRDAHAQLSTAIGAKKAIVTDPYSDAMRDAWARGLESLAAEFREGQAAVHPLPHACDYCGFNSLCRVAELHLATVAVDEEDEEAGNE
ncbi:MAG: PD-(D/E)XK nuclease family protein, partial [Candidatus Binataceae bacterium]